MSVVKHFRELRVYREAFESAMQIFEHSKQWPKEERYSLSPTQTSGVSHAVRLEKMGPNLSVGYWIFGPIDLLSLHQHAVPSGKGSSPALVPSGKVARAVPPSLKLRRTGPGTSITSCWSGRAGDSPAHLNCRTGRPKTSMKARPRSPFRLSEDQPSSPDSLRGQDYGPASEDRSSRFAFLTEDEDEDDHQTSLQDQAGGRIPSFELRVHPAPSAFAHLSVSGGKSAMQNLWRANTHLLEGQKLKP